jgi:hypothetical protein
MELAKQHEVTILTLQGLSLLSEIVEYGLRIIREPVFLEKKRLWLIGDNLRHLETTLLAGVYPVLVRIGHGNKIYLI